jgi:hypothetical protein
VVYRITLLVVVYRITRSFSFFVFVLFCFFFFFFFFFILQSAVASLYRSVLISSSE